MFYGTHEHTIDDKNRLTLPAKFRDGLGGGVVLVRGIDGTIDARPPRETWNSIGPRRLFGRSTGSGPFRAPFLLTYPPLSFRARDVAFFQGLVQDRGAPHESGIAITNGVEVRLR